MKKLVGFLVFALSMIVSSCSSDHDHFRGYDYDDYKYNYYYYDGYYYSDAEHHYRYDFDYNHYYYGRLEWKGNYWAIVLRENPYYGFICYIPPAEENVLYNQLGNVHDREVMVRFASFYDYDSSGRAWVHINHIYYR